MYSADSQFVPSATTTAEAGTTLIHIYQYFWGKLNQFLRLNPVKATQRERESDGRMVDLYRNKIGLSTVVAELLINLIRSIKDLVEIEFLNYLLRDVGQRVDG